jgi:DNA-binding NarL/FixJ family response regulator
MIGPYDDRVRVLVAHEHPAARIGIRQALHSHGVEVCGEAATAEVVQLMVAARHPTVCLISPGLPGGAAQAARDVVAGRGRTAVLMFAPSDPDQNLVDALRDGVAGWVHPDIGGPGLVAAVRAAASGQPVVPRASLGPVIDALRADGRRRLRSAASGQVSLTGREWRVVDLLGRGCSTAQAADRLGIEPVTIRRHLSSAMGKLGVSNRDAAVRLVRAGR